ncbi:MAG: hypothetical protein IJL20_06760 [Lachnospiraceae bacterium]|nr:hypothetical protein [Lachnospiraceae bacterium]MBR3581791.1 hypothetical protein [Lachnospiraceae bacterium]
MREKDKKPLEKPRGRRNQYHPQYTNTLHIELRENKDDLYFDEEFILNTGPLRIDLLIIKKNENAVIKSGLGAFFKKINIWEYKNPKDSLNVKEFNKGLAYRHLYIASSSEKISLSDVTLTFLRYYKPRDLFKELEKAGYKIEEYEPGIYHLGMMGQPNIQIIVSRLLDSKYEWVKAISDKIPLSEIDRLASEVENLDRTDRKYAITVLEFVGTINEIEEEKNMGVIRELFDAKDKIEIQEEQLKSKDEQLQSKDEQLQLKDEQLQSKDEEIKELKKEVNKFKERFEQLEKKLGGIAML